jgi:hypothetical protein
MGTTVRPRKKHLNGYGLSLLAGLFIVQSQAQTPPRLRPMEPRHGVAVERTAASDQVRRRGAPLATGGFPFINTLSREEVRAFYNAVYSSSNGTPIGWNGDVDACIPGESSSAFLDAVLRRINATRALAGVPADVSFNPAALVECQAAALMFSRNEALSHSPPPSWFCYSAIGAAAAARSNLSLGNIGYEALSSQTRDNGSNNARVGHRRWILFPQTQTMASGDVPASGSYPSANCLLVVNSGDSGLPRPTTREAFIAWPPPGYFPNPITPTRWSFSLDDGDFTAAVVSMQGPTGAGIPLVIDHRSSIGDPMVGENTMVWHPASMDPNAFFAEWPTLGVDTTYTIAISNIIRNGAAESYNYTVTVFDPSQLGPDTVQLTVAGPTHLSTGIPQAFTHPEVDFASGYQVRLSQPALLSGEDAETTDNIIIRTDGTYEVHNSNVVQAGSHSFHLAHPSGTPLDDHEIEWDKVILPGAGCELSFSSQLRWAATTQFALVEVSTDEGISWNSIYEQAGSDGPGESNFITRTVPLNAYAGQAIRLRFVYRRAGVYFVGTADHLGWFIDSILLSDAQELTNSTMMAVPNSDNFSWSSDTPGTYALDMRAQVWDDFSLEWGPVFSLAVTDPPPSLSDVVFSNAFSNLVFEVLVPAATDPGQLRLQQTTDLSGTWTDEPLSNYTIEQVNGMLQLTLQTQNERRKYLRIVVE